MKKCKIFMGFTEIAGYYYNLKKGFDEIGVDSHFFSMTPHPFAYDKEEGKDFSWLEKSIRNISNLRQKRICNKNVFIRQLFRALLCPLLLLNYISLMFKYDTFIIGFAYFPLRGIELPFLKLFKKKLICILHGSDSRPPYIDGAVSIDGADFSAKKLKHDTLKKRALMDKINKYADLIIDSPATSLFHTKKVLNILYFGIPCGSNDISKPNYSHDKAIRILHSPSHPMAKGTPYIEGMIRNLKTVYGIEFIKITGQPNSVVIEELNNCDFVVDQAYSDTPMAGFAAEAALMGKPAVVGGEFSGFISKYLREENIPPSLYVHPDKMQEAIERMIVDKDFRINLSKKAREFVREKWSRKAVAEKILNAIEGTAPDYVYFSPFELVYIGGLGMRAEWRKHVVRSLVENYGASALQLDDKPNLREALIKEASTSFNATREDATNIIPVQH